MSAMRIESAYQAAAVGYNKTKAYKAQSSSSVSFRDQLSLSGAAKDISSVRQALSAVPDVRADKVADIKSRIQAGTYSVSDDDTAESIANAFYALA